MFILSLLMQLYFRTDVVSATHDAVQAEHAVLRPVYHVQHRVLFASMWSKFAHICSSSPRQHFRSGDRADGSRENLPSDFDLTDPAVQEKFPDIPDYLGKNPAYMGHGIRREKRTTLLTLH